MKYVFLSLTLIMLMNDLVIFDSTVSNRAEDWYIVDDVVMGGRSSGRFDLDDLGNGVFHGSVSLDNNGGFSWVRTRLDRFSISNSKKIVLHIKGDGKSYQLRMKPDARNAYSYAQTFTTTGAWEKIEIPLDEMYPTFRGILLDMPNFSDTVIDQIGFLISNKREEDFKLMIKRIELSR